ncbi:hypothetical protein K456DRAFT_91150 [Colletotrichum gloeosporioides 23]|nr:hypothetical protein K456DRAFT_91150 [Colletotrichum gloeosporioides 23]
MPRVILTVGGGQTRQILPQESIRIDSLRETRTERQTATFLRRSGYSQCASLMAHLGSKPNLHTRSTSVPQSSDRQWAHRLDHPHSFNTQPAACPRLLVGWRPPRASLAGPIPTNFWKKRTSCHAPFGAVFSTAALETLRHDEMPPGRLPPPSYKRPWDCRVNSDSPTLYRREGSRHRVLEGASSRGGRGIGRFPSFQHRGRCPP